jgi:hypothetical protein
MTTRKRLRGRVRHEAVADGRLREDVVSLTRGCCCLCAVTLTQRRARRVANFRRCTNSNVALSVENENRA